MGLLRTLLAFTIVLSHSQPLFGLLMTGPQVAIKGFFIISGFYMALILNEKYVGPGSYRLFITNRLLRLFPSYLIVLALTVAMSAAYLYATGNGLWLGLYGEHIGGMDPASAALLALSNLLILGQDILVLFRLTDYGAFQFDGAGLSSAAPDTVYFLLVPQAWTISIEICFYILAPFLVTGGFKKVAALALAALAARLALYSATGFDEEVHRLLPTELVYFLLGSVSYRLYLRLRTLDIKPWLPALVTAAVAAITVFYQFIPIEEGAKAVLYYAVLFAALPMLFTYARGRGFDRYIGELSYPIYISHIFVLHATTYLVFEASRGSMAVYYLSLLAVAGVSVLLVHLVERPLEGLRQRRVLARAAISRPQ